MSDENFYNGARSSSYGSSEKYGESFFGPEYRASAGSFAVTTDPRTANKLKDVSNKLNTGIKAIEITALQPNLFETIPDQHLEELNRLRKLSKVDLSLHGPLIEASGISKEGVDEPRRQQAERQMASVVERANKLNPNGNIVITFHTTSGLPEMKNRVLTEEKEEKKEKVTEMYVINERDGVINVIKSKINYLEGEKESDPLKELKRVNEESWDKQLGNIVFHARQGREGISEAFKGEMGAEKIENGESIVAEAYKKYNTPEGQKFIDSLTSAERKYVERNISALNYADIYVRDAYNGLQEMFNKAWEVVQKDGNEADKKRLEEYRERMMKRIKEIKDPTKLPELADDVVKGVAILSTLSKTPETLKPLQDFVMERSSETYSNVALNAYKKFKDKAPIISLENPPVGMGIGRAEDMRTLIDASRKKLATKLVENQGLSESEAKQQADKLIGATWDVGHINMLRQYGYSEKDILEETKKIAPYVNKMHLSDNFGFEHGELPMGMGNVPMKGHLKELQAAHGDKIKDIKKIIEAGDWYQHFQTSPFKKTMEAFGSPIYGMDMAPYWNQSPVLSGPGYFSGYGMMLPEQHFSMYGAGFSNLPTELGGQMAGRSRLSGNQME
ncbi:sugar phosphate isomerase/epimerase [Candidatus Pacearchaeota archaeon]|nr:sugar phosphate isomerase/epimerase [Candidatus Pacearchaeota archaeon]